MHATPPPPSTACLSDHQTLPYLARLIVAGDILRLPSLRRFLSVLPSPLPSSPHLPLSLSLFIFPLFSPPSTITFLFNLLLRRLSLSRRHPNLPFSILISLLRLSPPDSFTFPPLLRSLHSPSEARQIHSQISRRGFDTQTYLVNNLLSVYSRFGLMPDACTLFDSTRKRLDVVSWNIMVNGYVRIGMVDVARKLFDEMPVRDEVSWSAMISGYAGNGEMDIARYLFERMPKSGKNVVTWNSMVAGFTRCGLLGLARRYFDEMPERNLVSWNAMVSGYAMNGEMDSAREMFEMMGERDVISWSCMISGYAQCGRHLEAMQLFEVMLKESRVRPNEVTMVSVLSACAHLSDLEQGKWIHGYIDMNGMTLDDDNNVGAALINMYFKCSDMDSALGVFHSLERKNVSSWNALITGLGISGLAHDALLAFEEMQRLGTKPDDITFVGILTACTHGGLVEEGRQYFKNMPEVYGVQPEMKHYGCMVDLLGRAGLLEEAEVFVKRMPMTPDIMVLGSLLGACRIHNNVEVTHRVQNDFLGMNSQQAGCHVLLSNIYAAADRWADASKMREGLKEKGIEKRAGSSSVELDLVV